MNSLENIHTTIHHQKAKANNSQSKAKELLTNCSSLPLPYHQHPSLVVSSNLRDPRINSSSQSVNGMKEKSFSCDMLISSFSSTDPNNKASHISSLDLYPELIPHVCLENQNLGSQHPQMIPSLFSTFVSCQEGNDDMRSAVSEPWGQCSDNSKASHLHPIYHKLEPDSCKHISCKVNPLEYCRNEHSLKTCDQKSKKSVGVSSVFNYKQYFTRRKRKQKEERKGTSTNRSSVIHLPKTSTIR